MMGSASHTKVVTATFAMECVENGCSHANREYLENCPSQMNEICKECSAEEAESDAGVVLWADHQRHLENLILERLDPDGEGA